MERFFSLDTPSGRILPEIRPVYDEFVRLLAERRFSAMDTNRIRRCVLSKDPVTASIRWITGKHNDADIPVFLIGRKLDKCYCIVHTYAVQNVCSFVLVDDNNDMVIPDSLSDIFLDTLLKDMKFRKSRASRVFQKVLGGVMVRDILDEDMRKARFRKVRNLLERV